AADRGGHRARRRGPGPAPGLGGGGEEGDRRHGGLDARPVKSARRTAIGSREKHFRRGANPRSHGPPWECGLRRSASSGRVVRVPYHDVSWEGEATAAHRIVCYNSLIEGNMEATPCSCDSIRDQRRPPRTP